VDPDPLLPEGGPRAKSKPGMPEAQAEWLEGPDPPERWFPISERMTGLSAPLKERLGRAMATKGKKLVIYFVGDSLVRMQYLAFCKVATGEFPYADGHAGTFQGVVNQSLHLRPFSCQSDDVQAVQVFVPFFSASVVSGVTALKREYPDPDVIYFSSAMWLLHLHPAQPMHHQMFEWLSSYKDSLRRALEAWNAAMPEARLEVMTPYSICTGKYGGGWRHVADAMAADPERGSMACVDAMVAKAATQAVAKAICKRYPVTDTGVTNIQEDIMEVVQGLPARLRRSTYVVDQHSLTAGHCDRTRDGRHYGELILPQLNEIFHVSGW